MKAEGLLQKAKIQTALWLPWDVVGELISSRLNTATWITGAASSGRTISTLIPKKGYLWPWKPQRPSGKEP